MTGHYWGDKWFKENGDDLYEAEHFIHAYVYKWTRCTLISKEKYGTIRYEYIVPPGGHIVRYVWSIWAPWKTKTQYGEYNKLLWAWNDCWLYKKWVRLGWLVTLMAIKKATKKWPNVEKELYADIDSVYWFLGKERNIE